MPLPRYLPFEAGPHRMRVGTRTLDPATWIELGPDTDGQLAEKTRVLADHHDEAVVLDPADQPVRAAARELLDALAGHLLTHAPDRYTRPGPAADPAGLVRPDGRPYAPAGLHPLETAARLVPEDLCLHLPGPDGVLRLVAAAVAFPSRWRPADKIGRPVGEIHAPVPGYADAIGLPVDRLLAGLTPDRGLWRLNAGLLDDPALFQPGPPPPGRSVDVPAGVVLRVERQTVRRLPVSGAVVFTIRTHVSPLADLADEPAACARVAGWLRSLPRPLRAYKSVGGCAPAVLDWLDARAG